jgi:hypothetical protein
VPALSRGAASTLLTHVLLVYVPPTLSYMLLLCHLSTALYEVAAMETPNHAESSLCDDSRERYSY